MPIRSDGHASQPSNMSFGERRGSSGAATRILENEVEWARWTQAVSDEAHLLHSFPATGFEEPPRLHELYSKIQSEMHSLWELHTRAPSNHNITSLWIAARASLLSVGQTIATMKAADLVAKAHERTTGMRAEEMFNQVLERTSVGYPAIPGFTMPTVPVPGGPASTPSSRVSLKDSIITTPPVELTEEERDLRRVTAVTNRLKTEGVVGTPEEIREFGF